MLSAVKIACLYLFIHSTDTHCSAGFHFSAGIAVWQGAALVRDHDCTAQLSVTSAGSFAFSPCGDNVYATKQDDNCGLNKLLY